MDTRYSFIAFTYIFSPVSAKVCSELSKQIPERTFTKDEIGFFTLLLVRGVEINKCPTRVYFNEEFTPFDALIVEDFVSFYKVSLSKFHRNISAISKNKLPGKRS